MLAGFPCVASNFSCLCVFTSSACHSPFPSQIHLTQIWNFHSKWLVLASIAALQKMRFHMSPYMLCYWFHSCFEKFFINILKYVLVSELCKTHLPQCLQRFVQTREFGFGASIVLSYFLICYLHAFIRLWWQGLSFWSCCNFWFISRSFQMLCVAINEEKFQQLCGLQEYVPLLSPHITWIQLLFIYNLFFREFYFLLLCIFQGWLWEEQHQPVSHATKWQWN